MFVETNSSKVQSERPKSMVGKGQADQWLQLRDKASDQLYYYQASTGSSTWSRPSNEHLIIPLDTMQEAIGAVDKVPNERPPSQMTSDQMTRASTGTISSVDTFDEKMVQGLGLAEDSVCVLIKGKEELTAEEIQVQNFIPTQYLVNSSPQTDRVRAPSHSFPHTHTHVSTPTLSAAHTDDMTYGSVVLATNNNKNASSDRLSASITHGTFRAAVSSNGYGMGIQGYDGQVICTHTRTSITSGSSDSLSPGSKVSVCVDVSVCVSPHGETYYDHGHNGVISNNKDSIVATSRRPSNKRCLSTGEFEDVLQIQTQQLLTSAPPERRASHVGHHRSQSECRPVPAPRPQATLRTTQAMSSPEIELNTIADASPIVTPKAQASASDSKRVSVVSPRPTQSQAQVDYFVSVP
ncbi:hypothetical protein SARC_02063 [Sphaeroforma arctica JP610]|uniref:WW domain-containing protein n=1 Tax=Sphaeroforma arctica JP610 TaxID=667725 RepID=A0A0L0GA22_9EUKA|nr:hypothetical protein SARC_02063 [Sphaeroforma arctica JP610]KNC85759.1 hypothetical protein SARC_02063 [Sphaeroforma arctica JP610]|eukprot:XP_014159661.1 hypothetical protein SARC_02063 [Sphaeroforma arctica JP610]